MGQSKKSRKNVRGLKRGKKVEAVKTLKVVDASSSTLFNGVSSGTHIPPAK